MNQYTLLIKLLLVSLASQEVRAQSTNIPPTVELRMETPTNMAEAFSTVLFIAHAHDADGEVQRIALFQNGIPMQEATGTNATFQLDVRHQENRVYAAAYDNAGAFSTSEIITFTGNIFPSLSIIEPVGAVAVYSLSNSVNIRATASDPDGSIQEVRLLENGRLIASDYQAPYEFVYRAPALGVYTLEVQAIDYSGGVSSQTRRVEYVRVIDDYGSQLIGISGTNLTLRSSNVNATRQKGEPNHAGAASGKSVWFAWRPVNPGTVTIDTIGSDFDTVLGVYTNIINQTGAITNLVTVAASDDDLANAPLSKVKFSADAGRTYYIAVDARDGFAGNVVLNIRQTPTSSKLPNDFIASATRIFTTPQLSMSNVGATKEEGEPDHAGNAGGSSLWWRIDGFSVIPTTVRISTAGSSFDTIVAVYTNSVTNIREPMATPAMENLRLVAENDDAAGSTNRTSFVEFTSRPSTVYWVAVDGYYGAEGTIRLAVTTQQATPAPPNNNFVAATVITGSSALKNVNTFGASTEQGEPVIVPGRQSGKSVWYRWIAPATGPVYVSTKWSDFDTLIGVYMGTNIFNLLPVASNDDDGGLQTSALVFNAIGGVEYRIVVAGYQNAGGDMVLMLNQPVLLPPRMVTQVIGKTIALSVEDLRGTAILESSSDLVNWTPIRVIEQEEPQLQIEPDSGQPQLFYRVRQLE